MLTVSACGGSGSSFLIWCAKKHGWRVCKRPDKPGVNANQIYRTRMEPFGYPKGWKEMYASQRAAATVKYLSKHKHSKRVMLLCMSWGHRGHLENSGAVHLIRHPVHAYVSYSGGGWLPQNRGNLSYVGATSPDDPKWIDAWLYEHSAWVPGAMHALDAWEKGTGHIVRYDHFVDDWARLPMPRFEIAKHYRGCSDDWEKTLSYIHHETVDRIMKKAEPLWKAIQRACDGSVSSRS